MIDDLPSTQRRGHLSVTGTSTMYSECRICTYVLHDNDFGCFIFSLFLFTLIQIKNMPLRCVNADCRGGGQSNGFLWQCPEGRLRCRRCDESSPLTRCPDHHANTVAPTPTQLTAIKANMHMQDTLDHVLTAVDFSFGFCGNILPEKRGNCQQQCINT